MARAVRLTVHSWQIPTMTALSTFSTVRKYPGIYAQAPEFGFAGIPIVIVIVISPNSCPNSHVKNCSIQPNASSMIIIMS